MRKKILLSIFILTLQIRLSAAVWPGETLQTASPESQGVDSAKLNQAMSYLASKCGSIGTEQAVIIRNGYMIWKGSDIDNSHNVWSASKSFTNTVLGLLIDDGKCTLDTYAKDYVSSLSSDYSGVKLRHFATMASGYNAVRHKEESICQSYTPFEPASPQFSPGSSFKYCDDAMNEFGNVLTRIAGRTMEDLFRDRIAKPIGMNDDKWDWADWGTVDGLVVNGGAGNKGKGLHISARELARFGLLFLNRGNWNGRQLISSSWVDQATSPQVPSSIPDSDGRYCYNWWHLSGTPVPTYMASGRNNNKCIVIRDWNMVIVRLGKDSNISNSVYLTFLDKVEDALKSPGKSPAAQAAIGAAVWPGRTWVTRDPAEVGMDPEKLAALADYTGGRGCVVRHGYMIYSWGSQSRRDYVYSAEKPWYAHFLWKALEDGKIPSLDQKVNVWEPRLNDINADLGYKDCNITWRHLANQTSCYGVRDNPGEAFNYNDYQMALFWDTLFLKVYGATYDTVDSAVLHPMLTDVLQCQDNPTFIESGHSSKGSLGVSARDFARFGLLYLREGNWKNKQLISAKHARMAVTNPLPATLPNSTEELAEVIDGQRTIGRVARVQKQGPHSGSYSWLWWMNGLDHEGNRNWPDAPADTYMAIGGGGNRMAVIPSLDIVVVSLGTPKGCRDKNEILRLLVKAVQSSNPADQKGRDDSGSHSGPTVTQRMVFPDRNWRSATPESQGVDLAKLKVAVAYMDENFGVDGAKQLVIVRNGRLIWEGPDSDAYHEIYSATKVFTSTILGLLIDSGKCTLETMAVEHLPGLADRYPAYAEIRLRHLVSMTGGYRGKLENVTPGQKWGDPIVYATTPDAPEFEPAGSQIAYNDHDVHLLGRILETRIAQEPLKDVFQRRIAGPIDMTRWDWGICGTVDGMVHYNAAGTPTLKGNGGVRITPRDLARLGQLYLNRGRWNGKQLLSASFVDEATATQIPASLPGRSSKLFSGAYGFYWWTNGVMTNGKRRYLAAPPKTYAAQGKNGNFCFVIPEWNMVIVRMGTRPIASYAQGSMKWNTFFTKLNGALCAPTTPHEATIHPSPITACTRVAIVNDKWHINGAVTYPGAKAEGLLMNVRMVNCTFEDLKRPDFDTEANTDEFITKIPDYVAHGVRAFTLNLQGGIPGYEGAVNSAFNADGTLRESYLKRIRRVIEACNREGAVVILGCYYQRQDQVLKDEDAVRTGVINTVKWIKANRFTNVVLEIANEYSHPGFDHSLLKTSEGIAELIGLAKQTSSDLLVSASGLGNGHLDELVARASDFLLIHFNRIPLDTIPRRIAALRQFGKPIICNEDAKLGMQAAKAVELCVANGASWGLMLERTNQHFPFTFNGAADDAIVYMKLKELTSPYLLEESFTGVGLMPCMNLSAVAVTAKERKN